MFPNEPWYFIFTSRSKWNLKCVHLADTFIKVTSKYAFHQYSLSWTLTIIHLHWRVSSRSALKLKPLPYTDWLLHIKTDWGPSYLRVLQNVLGSPTGNSSWWGAWKVSKVSLKPRNVRADALSIRKRLFLHFSLDIQGNSSAEGEVLSSQIPQNPHRQREASACSD